ncbi:MAG TPA: TolC family protein [Bryobacteraceae bacterium]|nr:TolC family protein [Bryobacteraceae bacterium]
MKRAVLLAAAALLRGELKAQQAAIEPVQPRASAAVQPYLAPHIPPIRLADSARLESLIRGGALYLTVQDAIALVLENDIDIEVARYNPLIAQWNLERSQAGGALPGVPSGASLAGSVANGQGIAGSQAAAGVAGGGFSGAGSNTANATISQIGPVTQNLDPAFQYSDTFSHISSPQANSTQTLSALLVSNTRAYSSSWQQGFLSGGAITLSYTDHYLRESAVGDLLNPSSAPNLSLSFQHNLLQGFGVAVNARTINVNRINLNNADLNFRTQVINAVANVVNLYYAMVAAEQDRRAKQSAVDAAEQFYRETRRREQLGAVSALDVTTAESQLASTQSDLTVSETNLRQQEVQLKNMLSRRGILDPLLTETRVVLLDRIAVPESDDLGSVDDLVREALENRSDLAADRANIRASEISAVGTINGILPVVEAIGGTSQAGLTGAPHLTPFGKPDPSFVGGIGNGLGQVFRRDFPTDRIGAFGQVRIYNRQAQADEGIDQLSLRQTELSTQKTLNQVQVDVSNYVVALRQARARYQAAVQNRILQQQLYDAEQRKFALGASTPYNVIQQQRDLVAAQASEVSAMASYGSARVALDQTLGRTLQANGVTIGEARSGVASHASSLPASLPGPRE